MFDLDAGPVTISLPNAGNRYMSMQVIDEDHFSQSAIYGAGSYTFSREKASTRYIFVLVRTLVDPINPKDLEEIHTLQDAIKVSQNNPGHFEVPNWDQASRKKVHDALLVLRENLPDTSRRMFGTKDQVDPVRHLIGTAALWGGLLEKDAFYLNLMPTKNDGTTIHQLSVKDVPADGFWSVSVFDAEGYFVPNQFNAYSLNNITATKSARFSYDPIRRLRRKDCQLPADYAGLELRGSPVSSARRNLGPDMDLSAGGADQLSLALGITVQLAT